MLTPRRKRTSLALLLILAAGLFAAGAGAAASTPEMVCCPDSMDAPAPGCAWLGAGDCCTGAPAASAPPGPAPATCGAPTLPAVGAAPAAIPSYALALPKAHAGLRTTVLRL